MKKEPIQLASLFPALDWEETKFHIAQPVNAARHPLDTFAQSFDDWRDVWTGGYHSQAVWTREFVFSLIEMRNEKDRWLFGGVFRVVSKKPGARNSDGKPGWLYKVADTNFGTEFVCRLIVEWQKDARSKHRHPLSNGLLDSMKVAEVLPEAYSGEEFPGHSSIDHLYGTLEAIWRDERPDWKVALEHCQGIYLITDTQTEMRYVGSASGDTGIWSRWGHYFKTGGHAGNRGLIRHLKPRSRDVSYVRENFRFCLIEQAGNRASTSDVIERESYWKRVLLTRGESGLNDN